MCASLAKKSHLMETKINCNFRHTRTILQSCIAMPILHKNASMGVMQCLYIIGTKFPLPDYVSAIFRLFCTVSIATLVKPRGVC